VYAHILISTDGSDLAPRGVDHGLSLAKSLGSKVTVITTTWPFPFATAYGGWTKGSKDTERYDAEQKDSANGILAAVRASAEKMGIEIKTVHVPNTEPAAAIIDTAQKLGCNLIVMASHGRRGIERVLLGSQTSEVLVTTAVPVLVVR
jgi:nucleotide-binding universal stress UspA family protein